MTTYRVLRAALTLALFTPAAFGCDLLDKVCVGDCPATQTGGESTGGASDSVSTSGSTAAPEPMVTTGEPPLETTGEAMSVATTGGEEGPGDDNTGGPHDPGTVEHACSPTDGPALLFRFYREDNVCGAGPTELDLRAVIYQGAPLAPGSYPLGAGLGHWQRLEDGVLTTGDAGTVIINAWDEGGVSGHFELADENGFYPGYFDLAPLCGPVPMCG